MIKNKDRSFYIGASDTKYVMGNWNTKSFEKWWLEKIKLDKNNFSNEFTLAGTNYEHKILNHLNIPKLKKDKQIKKGRLRVNLDGNTIDRIFEVKTYRYDNDFKVSKEYNWQVQVQMYITNIKVAYIVAYGLLKEDYNNYFNNIDEERLSFHKICYNQEFINEYKIKLKYLIKCLKKGKFPKEEDL